jgi:hypothetical protein
MSCSAPIYYLLHRVHADGHTGLLMAPDLETALSDARAGDGWTPERITLGRETILEGDALRQRLAELERG